MDARARRARTTIATALALLLAALVLSLPARAAPRLQRRPPQAVAYAEVAVVRLVVSYYAITTQGASVTTQTPSPFPCTGLATLVATTGSGGNTRTYLLTSARLVSPVQPCQGAINAFTAATKSTPNGWQLEQIQAFFNTSYTGDGPGQPGAFFVSVDPKDVPVLGTTDGPIALPLAKEPGFDLPVIVVPAAPPTGTTTVLDLGDATLAPFTNDAISADQVANELTPIQSAIPAPAPAVTPTAAPTVAPGTATATTAPTAVATPTPFPISPGAPVIDAQGNLAGIVITSGTGLATVGVAQLTAALSQTQFAVSRPGAFDTQWNTALSAYYAASPTNPNDANYARAATLFAAIKTAYPAFHGVEPWLAAARAGQPNLGGASPTASPTPAPARDVIPGVPIHSTAGLIVILLALLALLGGLVLWMRALSVRGRLRRAPAETGDTIERRATQDDLPASWRLASLRPTVPLSTSRRIAPLAIQAGGLTDPGVRRKADPNQDNILSLHGARLHDGDIQPFGIFVVADGMGGHQNGREASMRAIEVMVDHLLQPLVDGGALTEDALLELLRGGVERANAEIHQRNLRTHTDMGTTITAALVTGDIAHLANVGDSRTYHLQPEFNLRQVTVDHSVVAGLVAAGVIRPEDIYTHPKRNQIYRSLGEKDEVDVDTFRVVLQPGDSLLLCSDGLWEMVRDPRIEEILRYNMDLQATADLLIKEANGNGGVDNISAIIVRMQEEPVAPKQTGFHIYAGPSSLVGR